MKKGQAMSLFLIVGVILLISFGIFLYLRAGINKPSMEVSTDFETQKVQLATQIQDCLRAQTKEGVGLYGLDYWSSGYEIEEYIETNIDKCIPFEAFEKAGLGIEKEDIEANATITDNYLEIKVRYPITISSKISSAEIENFVYDMEISKEKFLPNKNGFTTQDVVIELEDAGIKLEIPKGTLMLDLSNVEKGKEIPRVDKVKIDVKGKNILQDNFCTYVSNKIFDFKPDDTYFYPAVKLSISYDENLLPKDLNEKNLKIVYYDENSMIWDVLDTIVDEKNNILVTHINHFTEFAIMIAEKADDFNIDESKEKEFCDNLYYDLNGNIKECIDAILNDKGYSVSGFSKWRYGKKFFSDDFLTRPYGINAFTCGAAYFFKGGNNIVYDNGGKDIAGTSLFYTGLKVLDSIHEEIIKTCNSNPEAEKKIEEWAEIKNKDSIKAERCLNYLEDVYMPKIALEAKDACYMTLAEYDESLAYSVDKFMIVKCADYEPECRSYSLKGKYDTSACVEIIKTNVDIECPEIKEENGEVGETKKGDVDDFLIEEVKEEPPQEYFDEDVFFSAKECKEILPRCKDGKVGTEDETATGVWEGGDAECIQDVGNGVTFYGSRCTEFDDLYISECCYQFPMADPIQQAGLCPEGTQLRLYHCPGDNSVRCCVRDEVLVYYSGGGEVKQELMSITTEDQLRMEIDNVLAEIDKIDSWTCEEDLENLKIFVSRINSIYASPVYSIYVCDINCKTLSDSLIKANEKLIGCVGEEAAEEIIEEAKEEAEDGEVGEEEVFEETECCCVSDFDWDDDIEKFTTSCYPEDCDADVCSENIGNDNDKDIRLMGSCSEVVEETHPCST